MKLRHRYRSAVLDRMIAEKLSALLAKRSG